MRLRGNSQTGGGGGRGLEETRAYRYGKVSVNIAERKSTAIPTSMNGYIKATRRFHKGLVSHNERIYQAVQRSQKFVHVTLEQPPVYLNGVIIANKKIR